tara:strand:+ start:1043 stop:1156 length:114 start_codon:yes stop_codon:yes gene_type:complete
MIQHLPEDLRHLEAIGWVFMVGTGFAVASFLFFLVTE